MKEQSTLQIGKVISTENAIHPQSGDPMCHRCGGWMVRDQVNDPLCTQGRSFFHMYRCLQCGDVLDEVILKNRKTGNFNHPMPPHRRPSALKPDTAPLGLRLAI